MKYKEIEKGCYKKVYEPTDYKEALIDIKDIVCIYDMIGPAKKMEMIYNICSSVLNSKENKHYEKMKAEMKIDGRPMFINNEPIKLDSLEELKATIEAKYDKNNIAIL